MRISDWSSDVCSSDLITFGPATDVGFYYDFAREIPFTEDDLAAIEAKMREIVKRDLPITREVWEHDAAVKYFENAGETYKAEWIRDGIAADEELTIYKQGDQWLDMCLGPHLPSTGKLGGAFKQIVSTSCRERGCQYV